MLSIVAQRKALERLKIPKEKIDEILGDAEVDIDDSVLAGLTVYDATGLAELEKNIKKGGMKDYPEIWAREMNDTYALGLTGKDAKDQGKVIEAMKAKFIAEAGINPVDAEKKWKDEKIALQAAITAKETEGLSWKEKYDLLQSDRKYQTLFWPEMSDSLDSDEWISRLRKNFEIVTEDGVECLKELVTGKIVKDDKQNVIPYKEAFAEKIKDDKYKTWHKQVAAVIEPAKRQTHDSKNPINPAKGAKKYNSTAEIQAEVDKKIPKDSKKPGNNKARQDLFRVLSAQLQS